jgi:hypothetical protein
MAKFLSLLSATTAFWLAASPAHATVLLFNDATCLGGNPCSNGMAIDQTYGDSSSVNVEWRFDSSLAADTNNNFRYWGTNYSELLGIGYGTPGANGASVFFAPLQTGAVTLNSFRLGGWPSTTRNTSFTIFNGLGNVLFSSGDISVGTGNQSNLFTVNLASTNGIGVKFGPDSSNVGIDNIDFSFSSVSAVPEPSTWAMLILGFGLIGGAMRSSKRREKASLDVASLI